MREMSHRGCKSEQNQVRTQTCQIKQKVHEERHCWDSTHDDRNNTPNTIMLSKYVLPLEFFKEHIKKKHKEQDLTNDRPAGEEGKTEQHSWG